MSFVFFSAKKETAYTQSSCGWKKKRAQDFTTQPVFVYQMIFFFWSIKSTGKFRFLIRSSTVYSYFFFLEKFRFGEKKSDYKCN